MSDIQPWFDVLQTVPKASRFEVSAVPSLQNGSGYGSRFHSWQVLHPQLDHNIGLAQQRLLVLLDAHVSWSIGHEGGEASECPG